jgi:2-oxo-4-hydroxy-4-carboxy--5-ureidoimidazoline (OHCU) decarboxylase
MSPKNSVTDVPYVARVPTDVERNDLQSDIGTLIGLDEWLKLAAHHVAAADRRAQHRLVHHHPQLGRVATGEDALALHSQADPSVDLGGPRLAVAEHDDGPGVVGGLQQP